jgi:hypothetical protein
MTVLLRGDFDASRLRGLAKKTKDGPAPPARTTARALPPPAPAARAFDDQRRTHPYRPARCDARHSPVHSQLRSYWRSHVIVLVRHLVSPSMPICTTIIMRHFNPTVSIIADGVWRSRSGVRYARAP